MQSLFPTGTKKLELCAACLHLQAERMEALASPNQGFTLPSPSSASCPGKAFLWVVSEGPGTHRGSHRVPQMQSSDAGTFPALNPEIRSSLWALKHPGVQRMVFVLWRGTGKHLHCPPTCSLRPRHQSFNELSQTKAEHLTHFF